jgi:DNA ligase-1
MEYGDLVDVYRRLEATASTVEKTLVLARAFVDADDDHLPIVVKLVRGKLFAAWRPDDLGVSSALTLRAVAKATGVDEATIEERWRETGDLGDAAAWATSERRQRTLVSPTLDVRTVHDALRALADYEGAGSQERRIDAVARLVSEADGPDEARYVVRTALGHMRLGVGSGTVRDAVAEAFLVDGDRDVPDAPDADDPTLRASEAAVAAVERAYQVTNDYRVVATTARDEGTDGLRALDVEPFRPIRAMLARKADGLAAAVADVADRPGDVLAEYKYDGARMQVHVDGDEVRLFTRRLEDVTDQFPEVVAAVESGVRAGAAVVDGEAVGYDPDTGRPVPFQEFSRRIKRKYDVADLAESIPTTFHAFDLLYVDGDSLLDDPLRDRLDRLDDVLTGDPGRIERAARRRVDDTPADGVAGDGGSNADRDREGDGNGDADPDGDADRDRDPGSAVDDACLAPVRDLYDAALDAGHEGLMVKNLAAAYQPGRRVGYAMKLKPVMEPLDLVVTRAQWSEGRRSDFLGRLFLGAYDPEADAFREVGRLSTGYTDEELAALTDRLTPLVVASEGRRVDLRPEVVVGVEYEEIQSSTEYDSGFALRFPRFLGVREDLAPAEADTVARVRELYDAQSSP